uniref:PH domain-containing protein n=1 Tax=candidate division WOR-3 bacterium TaxID=2052148 RepID=A0A7C3IMM1_UNCW3
MDEQEISWQVHRAREQPAKTVLVSSFILLFLLFTLFSFGPALMLVALIVLSVATHTYFLPITYRLNARGITIDKKIFSYTYEWSRFRRFFCTSGGVVLSPFSKKTFLDNFRGVHLLLPDNPAPVLEYLKYRFPDSENNKS